MKPVMPCKTPLGIFTGQFNINRLPYRRKRLRTLRFMGLLWALSALVATAKTQSQPIAGVVDVPLVVTLLNAHMSSASIIAMIQDKGNTTNFVLSPENIKALNAAAVTPEVLSAMFSAAVQSAANTPATVRAPALPAAEAAIQPGADAAGPVADPATAVGATVPAPSSREAAPDSQFAAGCQNLTNHSVVGLETDAQKALQAAKAAYAGAANQPACQNSNLGSFNPICAQYYKALKALSSAASSTAKWMEVCTLDPDLNQGDAAWFGGRAQIWTAVAKEADENNPSFPPYQLSDDLLSQLQSPVSLVVPSVPAPADLPTAPTTSVEHFGIAGVTVAAASSTSPEAKLFAELYGDFPLGMNKSTHFRGWGYARIGSISQTDLSVLSTQGESAATTLTGTQVQQLVQSGELAAGLEFRLSPWSVPAQDTTPYKEMPSISLVVGGGGITPLSVQQATSASASAYQVSPSVQQYFTSGYYGSQYLSSFQKLCPPSDSASDGGTSGTPCYVALYPQDRSRFFTQYNFGLRFKLPIQVQKGDPSFFPTTLDANIGQNEYVTGGTLHNWVLHLGGESPLPYFSGLYIFGGMDMSVTGQSSTPEPLLFPAPTTGTNAAGPSNTINIVTPPPNRDRYLLGLGFDIVGVIQAHLKKDNDKAQAAQ
jgi:hypothetical protein